MDRVPPAGYLSPPTVDQQQQRRLQELGYDLPCEFAITGCGARFHPLFKDSWIEHTITHVAYNASLPSKTLCIFCDAVFDCAERGLDPAENWRERMEHISEHFQDGVRAESARPDFFVLKHMQANGLISQSLYKYLAAYSERLGDGLKSLGRDDVDDDEVSDGEATDEPNEVQTTESLSCPDCNTTNFPSLSKLNKHRNTHTPRYKCYAKDCEKRFAQQQALDRHTNIIHRGTERPKKYYHCIVDGCKYASTGKWKKFFARMDQVKEHIKDYGHYGPHSASDRPRRPGKLLTTDEIIKVVFEEWTLEADVKQNEILRPRRSIRPYEYDPRKTKLWHKDDTGDLYLHGNTLEDDAFEAVPRHRCLVPGCYYQLLPPGGLGATAFKTSNGLLEHRRRAHGLSNESASLKLQHKALECAESGGRWASTDFAEMSTWLDISPYKSGPSLLGVRENVFEDEEFLGLEQYQSQTWETADSQHSECSTFFSEEVAAPMLHLPSPATYSSTNGSDLWISTPRSENGDNRPSISPLLTNGMSIARPRSTEPSPRRLKCEASRCEVTFKRRGDMKRHLKSVHRQSTRQICLICKQQFRRKDSARNHLLNVHRIAHDSGSTHLRSLTLVEESVNSGGDVVSEDAIMKDVVSEKGDSKGSMGQFSSLESLEPGDLFLPTVFGPTFAS